MAERVLQRRPGKAAALAPEPARAARVAPGALADLAARLNAASALERPPQAREAPPAPDRTGLGTELKRGVEALSGLSLDHVSVTRLSPEPARYGALAFAQGARIHLAPGQERHLPHEAWHVVQQAQGRVPATRQLRGGTPANDDRGLEREADLMGTVAARLGRDMGGVGPSMGGAPTPVDDEVMQRLVAQVSLSDAGDDTIAQINIAGRPPPTYGPSMGDHSTAFVVHLDGIRRRLVGGTVREAFEQMDSLIGALNALPGAGLIANLETARLDRLGMKVWELQALRRPPKPEGAAQLSESEPSTMEEALRLQDLITCYLELRELIPLSTINVASLSQGTAGKGGGEAQPAALLAANEAVLKKGLAGGGDPGELRKACFKLLDDDSLALIALAPDAMELAELAPGLTGETRWRDRVTLVLQQHHRSLLSSYPRTIRALFDSEETAVAAFENHIRRRILKETEDAKSRAEQKFKAQSSIRYFGAATEIERSHAIDRAEEQRMTWANSVRSDLGEAPLEVERPLETFSKRGHKPPERFSDMSFGAAPASSSGKTSHARRSPSVTPFSVDAGEERSPVGHAVQLHMRDGVVSSIAFAGRPASPHSGTMGAHLTAWIVHQDQVRARLLGCNLDQAFDRMEELIAWEAGESKALASQFSLDRRQLQLRQRAEIAMGEAQTRLREPSPNRPLRLQAAVVAYLALVNLGPGVTRAASKTTGEGEGHPRAVLRDYEAGRSPSTTPAELWNAIAGLIDVGKGGEALSEGEAKAVWARHRRTIERTYPVAYAAAKPGGGGAKSGHNSTKRRRDPGEVPEDRDTDGGGSDRRPPQPERTEQGLDPGQAAAGDLLKVDGSLSDESLRAFVTAYRDDIRGSRSYLGEGEADVAARRLGIRVDIVRQPPQGFARFPNGGGGDCLIHSLVGAAEVLHGRPPRGASVEEVSQMRAHIADAYSNEFVEAAVGALVEAHKAGAGEPGLGPGVRRLLDRIPQAPPAAAPAVSTSSSSGPAPVKTSEHAMEDVPAAQLPNLAVVQLGEGMSSHGVALLHRGAHYELLVRDPLALLSRPALRVRPPI